jgi:hypothetical protein
VSIKSKVQFKDRSDAYWDAKTDKDGFIIWWDTDDEPILQIGDWWGNWELTKNNCLIYHDSKHEYEIDLDRAKNINECSVWIFHMIEKNWITDADIGSLVRAFSDIKEIHR